MNEGKEGLPPLPETGQQPQGQSGVNKELTKPATEQVGRSQACEDLKGDDEQEGEGSVNPCTKEDGRPVRRRRPIVRQLRRKEEAGDDHLRLWIRVPADVKAVLAKANKDPAEEISRVVEALWQKLTPQPGPVPTATYAPEVLAFERVLSSDRETLTLNERLFRVLNEAHEEVSTLEEKLEQKALPPFLIEVVLTLAKGVFEAQAEVRKDWGVAEEDDAEEGL